VIPSRESSPDPSKPHSSGPSVSVMCDCHSELGRGMGSTFEGDPAGQHGRRRYPSAAWPPADTEGRTAPALSTTSHRPDRFQSIRRSAAVCSLLLLAVPALVVEGTVTVTRVRPNTGSLAGGTRLHIQVPTYAAYLPCVVVPRPHLTRDATAGVGLFDQYRWHRKHSQNRAIFLRPRPAALHCQSNRVQNTTCARRSQRPPLSAAPAIDHAACMAADTLSHVS
jgi:hypothetical protein